MTESLKTYVRAVGTKARAASRLIGRAETAAKNRALEAIADALETGAAALIA
jgi:glutamate-5-semialdehyde dehydrogenase